MTEPLTVEEAADRCRAIAERVEEAVVVDTHVLYETLAGIIARGHILIEDVPGTGKTVLARVLAESLGLQFTRIQFTPDLLPADVTGSNIYNEHEGAFEFAQGPVFTNVALADEINRAPPKTQSALLESMEEGQVSVDGTTHDLPEPFVVIATQNPVEQEGTFRLPEAQRDRFSVKTSMGYPDVEGEMGLLERRDNRRTLAPSVEPTVEPETVLALQDLAEEIRVDEKIRRYIVDLARETREDDRTEIGVSPRGVQRVFEAVRASAVIGGREYVTPEDVKRMARATMSHRLILTTEATVENVDPDRVVQDAMDRVDVPAVSPDAPDAESENGVGSDLVRPVFESKAAVTGEATPRTDGQ
jgi:MoxR-like ATPase